MTDELRLHIRGTLSSWCPSDFLSAFADELAYAQRKVTPTEREAVKRVRAMVIKAQRVAEEVGL